MKAHWKKERFVMVELMANEEREVHIQRMAEEERVTRRDVKDLDRAIEVFRKEYGEMLADDELGLKDCRGLGDYIERAICLYEDYTGDKLWDLETFYSTLFRIFADEIDEADARFYY